MLTQSLTDGNKKVGYENGLGLKAAWESHEVLGVDVLLNILDGTFITQVLDVLDEQGAQDGTRIDRGGPLATLMLRRDTVAISSQATRSAILTQRFWGHRAASKGVRKSWRESLEAGVYLITC